MSLLMEPMKYFLAGLAQPSDDLSVKTNVDLLLNEANEAKNDSSALLSRVWGTFVGLFLGDPMKWGEFASTKSCIAERVRHWIYIRTAPNHSENSPYGEAVRYYSKPLMPATVADIMKVSKAQYQKYEHMSDVLATTTIISGVAMVGFAAIKVLKSGRIQLPVELIPVELNFLSKIFVKK